VSLPTLSARGLRCGCRKSKLWLSSRLPRDGASRRFTGLPSLALIPWELEKGGSASTSLKDLWPSVPSKPFRERSSRSLSKDYGAPVLSLPSLALIIDGGWRREGVFKRMSKDLRARVPSQIFPREDYQDNGENLLAICPLAPSSPPDSIGCGGGRDCRENVD
jgi:hypothetical protein